jgi:hypothetical protein
MAGGRSAELYQCRLAISENRRTSQQSTLMSSQGKEVEEIEASVRSKDDVSQVGDSTERETKKTKGEKAKKKLDRAGNGWLEPEKNGRSINRRLFG